MERSKKPPDHLTLCSIAAQKEGLSYGKYMVKYNYAPPCLAPDMEEPATPAEKPQKPKAKVREIIFPEYKPCEACGKIFLAARPKTTRFCSVICRNNAKVARAAVRASEKRMEAAPRYCVTCGGQIPPDADRRKITCSKECAKRRKYAKSKQNKDAARGEVAG